MEEEKNIKEEEEKKENKKKIELLPIFKTLNLSFKTYSKNIGKFTKVYLWGLLYLLVPLVILIFLMFLGTINSLQINIIFRIVYIFIFLLSILALIYYSLRISISFFLLIQHNYSGRELDIYRESAHYVWSFLWLKILVGLIILLWLLFLSIPITLITILPAILVFFIYPLAILPAFIYIIYYSLALYVFFFEHKRGMMAIKKSKKLIKNYWWALTWRWLIITVIVLVIEFIIYSPLLFIPNKSVLATIWNIIFNIIIYLIIPFVIIFFTNIYRDLSKIKK